MTQQFAKSASAIRAAAKQAWTAVVETCCALLGERPQTYRPEAYYMRGPGPKWREKHPQTRDILR
jgi:hypothetical protein